MRESESKSEAGYYVANDPYQNFDEKISPQKLSFPLVGAGLKLAG
jgi:hypothetical protein